MFMHEISQDEAKARFMNYVAFRSEKYHLKSSYVSFIKKVVIPLQRRLRRGFARRKQIKEYLRTTLLTMRQSLIDMNLNSKKNKKIKETLKAVKKIDDEQMENITELVNRIVISRHKLKMIWYLINRQMQDQKELTEDQEETKEEGDGEQQDQQQIL